MTTALTIAGSDPSGGAGAQLDLRIFHCFRVYGISVITSLTAQNTGGVEGILPVNSRFVRKQLEVLIRDIMPDGTKTGMLYSEENVEAIADKIRRHGLKNLVVDPVILSSTGKKLAKRGVPNAVKRRLLPLCTVATPNIHEASVLSGIPVRNRSDMEKAARRLRDLGCANVIVTGGHLEGTAVDLVYDGSFHYLRSPKISGEYHGTGCAFSAVLTVFLSRGSGVLEAAREAKKFMNRALRRSFETGRGMKLFSL